MESELNREILCADEICWVVSFIKISGLNLLWNSLRKFTSEGKKLRVITTTYTGATDYDAIARLASLPNTEIKISYDGTQDRLHAKSLFSFVTLASTRLISVRATSRFTP